MPFAVATLSFIAFVAYFVCLVSLHFLPTGYSPLYNTISDFSVGRFSRLARMSVAVNGMWMIPLPVIFCPETSVMKPTIPS